MSKLEGWVAGWTDWAADVQIMSAWTSEDEAKAACQQDQRNGEDMSDMGHVSPIAEEQREVLEWEHSEQIGGATAECGNGQGTYFVHKV